jgi:glycosyltransferase involved in cell wall biosynthesis
MRILVDARPLQHIGYYDERARFILTCLKGIARKKVFEYKLLIDNGLKNPMPADRWPGGEFTAKRALPGSFGWKWWFDHELPRWIRSYGADFFLSTGGLAAGKPAPLRRQGDGSMREGDERRVPQCLWMPVQIAEGEEGSLGAVFKKRWMRSVQGASSVLCFSEDDKVRVEELAEKAGQRVGVAVLKVFPDEDVMPPAWEERERLKTDHAGGKEYFFSDIGVATKQTAIDLLKAFSIFKKKQRSNLRLVLTGEPAGRGETFGSSLDSYKYRDEVHWYREAPEADRVKMKTAGYGQILLMRKRDLGIGLLNAWKAGVPVIAAGVSSRVAELAGENGALFIQDRQPGNERAGPEQPGDGSPERLAVALMRMYKDETLRGSMIEAGMKRLGSFEEGSTLAEIERMLGKG